MMVTLSDLPKAVEIARYACGIEHARPEVALGETGFIEVECWRDGKKVAIVIVTPKDLREYNRRRRL